MADPFIARSFHAGIGRALPINRLTRQGILLILGDDRTTGFFLRQCICA